MGILLKGIEMPEEGNWRTVRIYPNGACAAPNWQGDCTFYQGVQAVPFAEKRGEWLMNDNGTYSCSICKSWIPAEQKFYARYCLHCGAKMESEE